MKKLMVMVICGALVAPLAYAQTNVLSQNAVGYVKTTLVTTNPLTLVSQDFVDIDGNAQSPSTVIGDQMPLGSRLFVWDVVGQIFDIENYAEGKKTAPDAWTPDTASLEPGVGFFLELPAGAPNPSYDVYMLGEVPSDATTDLDKTEALALFGFPYPASQSWTGTALAASALVGDRLFTWDVVNQIYDISNYAEGKKTASDAWTNPGDVIAPGQGFFYESGDTNTVTVSETKPYAWP